MELDICGREIPSAEASSASEKTQPVLAELIGKKEQDQIGILSTTYGSYIMGFLFIFR